ncbi:uncharacterized protein LOC126788320 [Argentina anserina]|uniref:uncharacterized protein LOC126788320 n=1 Tax=Argentina anserina TaxID=57926 RepID=UPI00217653A8|nr:uncharacterized protein LOC126788320 [Potentilla anserina]
MEKTNTFNGIAWFENIYQTFDDVYHDMDGIMKQAESQLVTVGTNVKNFFSDLDVIRDVLPQSSVNKTPGAAPDTYVVQTTNDAVDVKSAVGSDGGHGDEVHIGSVEADTSVASGLSLGQIDDIKKLFQLQTPDKLNASNADQDIGAQLLVPASDYVGDCKSVMEAEDRSTNLVDMYNEDQDIGLDSGAKLLIPAPDDIGAEERTRNLVDMSSEIPDETRLSNALEMDNLYKKNTAEAEWLKMCDASSCDQSETTRHYISSEGGDNDDTDSDLQTLRSLEKELGESCILVDRTEFECSCGEAAKHSSYKKKLKDAFAAKIRLLKNHNYGELKRNRLPTLAPPEKSNPPDNEFCESDWEIV